jgi:hypothetical protein
MFRSPSPVFVPPLPIGRGDHWQCVAKELARAAESGIKPRKSNSFETSSRS